MTSGIAVLEESADRFRDLAALISEIASHALNIDDLEDFFYNSLQIIGTCLAKSGCYIWKFSHSSCQLNMLCEWSASGVPSLYDHLLQVEIIKGKWWTQAHDPKRGLIFIEGKDLFSAQANALLNSLSLDKLVALPLYVNGRAYGFLGVSSFDNDFKWRSGDIEICKTAACIISKTIESHRLNKSVREKENRFDNILQTIPCGVYEINTAGIIECSNLAYQKLTGYSEEELIGTSVFDLLPNEAGRIELKEYLQFLTQCQPAPRPWFGVNQAKNGQLVEIQLDWNYRRDSNGLINGFICVVTDVAERQKERSQLEKANAYLEHQVRKRTQKLSGANAELKARQEQLVKSRKELTRMNRDLSEANRALTILSKNLGQNKSSSKREIALTISSKVLPIVDKLRVASSTQDDQTDLDTLALYLKELTAPLDKGEKLFTLLSAMEMKVAIKIKNGMTTSQIAKELFISEGTVKSHRRNIRRKLGLKNARINLRNYLRLKSRKIVS